MVHHRFFISSSKDFTAQRIAKNYRLKAELILEFFGNLQAGTPRSIHSEKGQTYLVELFHLRSSRLSLGSSAPGAGR